MNYLCLSSFIRNIQDILKCTANKLKLTAKNYIQSNERNLRKILLSVFHLNRDQEIAIYTSVYLDCEICKTNIKP